jgi:macrolide transport system ATP-binding/permease protein
VKETAVEWLTKLGMRWRALRQGEDVHREIAEEWRLHMDLRTEENIRRGMSPKEARQDAVQHFGNYGHIKDLSWDVRGGGMAETLWQDLRFGVRQLQRSAGFTIAAIVSLALGIGANTVIFSWISTILLRPLPVAHPEQLFAIHQTKQKDPSYSQSMSYPNFKDIRDRNEVLSGMALYRFAPMSISHSGENERVWGYLVSENYFDVLAVKALVGRTFAPEEGQMPLAHPVVVLSNGCWHRRFGGDPAVVGSTVRINGHEFTAIGVAPPEFTGTESIFTPEFWIPSMMQAWIEAGRTGLENRGDGQWFAFGRLNPGVGVAQAQAQLNSVVEKLGKEYPQVDEGMALSLTPPGLVDPGVRSGIIAFSGALMLTVILVLMIACTNLASLLSARAAQRRKEIAVRMAIGATRTRLARQLLTESVLLSVIGGAFGLMLGIFLMRVAERSLPPMDIALTLDLRLDWRVLSFVVSLAVLTGIGFGLIPALQASRADVVSSLKEDTSGGRRRRAWLRSGLVTLQVALSLVLLITAGLTIRSLQHTSRLGPGFDPENALAMSVDPGLQGYDEARGETFYRQMAERVRTLPRVKTAGIISVLPLSLDASTTSVYPEGQPEPNAAEMPSAMYNSVGPGYFAAMGIPLAGGREFTDNDTEKSQAVVIVNQTVAQRFWPGQDAVGKHLNSGQASLLDVVGVANNGKYRSLGEDPNLAIYYPLTQQYATSAVLVVRTIGDPRPAIASVRSEVQKLDPNLPVYNVKTLAEHMNLALFPLHAGTVAVGSFALLALILATIGIYGVMAYSVSQRRQEIGIRMALGARAIDVWRMVLKHGVVMTTIGMGIGLICAIALSRVVASLLYGVSATDFFTFVLVSLLLAAVAMAACFIPARRATKVDPVIAIKCL